jgi:hypothetical protein
MTESKLSISSKLSVDTIISKLKASTVDTNQQSQTNYNQIFEGKIGNDFAEISDIYATPRHKLKYKIKVVSVENNITSIVISNNAFEIRQFTNAILKALVIPIGGIIIILGFLYFQNGETLLTTLTIGLGLIIIPLLFKLTPLSEKDFLDDTVIKHLIELLDPVEIKLLDK